MKKKNLYPFNIGDILVIVHNPAVANDNGKIVEVASFSEDGRMQVKKPGTSGLGNGNYKKTKFRLYTKLDKALE